MKKVLNNTTVLSVGLLVVFVVSKMYFGWDTHTGSMAAAEFLVNGLMISIWFRLIYVLIQERVNERLEKKGIRGDSDE
jgi:membrane protein CcdC involved in cytochrome C biogenesis